MRKHRIALFTGNYNHIRDGVSNTLNRLVAHLELNGFDVRVFGPWTPEPVITHEGTFVPVYAIPAPFRPEYRVSLGFPETERAVLREFDPDLIHIATPDILGFRALRYAMKYKIPVVSSFHTHFSSYLKYYGVGFLEKFLQAYLFWFYRNCTHLYVPSPSMLEDLRSRGIKTDLRIWSRGVDTSLFHPDKRSEAWRKSKGFDKDDIVVCFVSRLVWEKNLDVVAKTFQKLKDRNVSIRTLVVGDGPAMKEFSENLPETVFTGFLEKQDLAEAYAGSDLFFFPSDTESFGNVTLEAMSCGLPAVVADASGSSSLVENNINGYRADARDVDSFTTQILQITENHEMRIKMAKESRKKAAEYDWTRVLDTLISYYREII